MSLKSALAGATLAVAFTAAAFAHGPSGHEETAFGRPGDEDKPNRVVEVIMNELDGKMTFEPHTFTVTQGDQIRFRITNKGMLEHEFVLATLEENLKHAEDMKKHPEMEHDEPNMKRIKPNGTAEVLWRFTKVGKFHIGCLIPGHLGAGMEAHVIVLPAKATKAK
ncbi:MAG TPA: plastocyanin/azurin family copper-binding protein [Hyphomicrobiaceae bacterium]|nr:plastocyanin/azurin family copper-binding protein [Hyphomicrobiaceae bacterium]